MRNFWALIAGMFFGAGLFTSGMTDTAKVQGWLDIFGGWDPTLAFVLGGAILPTAVAWRVVARRDKSFSNGAFPNVSNTKIDRKLIIGSLVFGAGWALSGLCPGPSLASISYGGTGLFVFLAALIAGMAIAPKISRLI
ncbi:MAG: hypothetical protein L3J33_12865 [Rhodobacteraceae bacterium]|nr:hypothetical protein [Paracoccaceae bacterium]